MKKAKILLNPNARTYATWDCPDCNAHATLDKDQYYGKVSIQCKCGFHKTIDFRNVAEKG